LIKEKTQPPENSGQPREVVFHPQHISDHMLWNAFRSGDERAFITIFDRYTAPMFNYGCKITAERDMVKDSIQELFIEIWQNRSGLGHTNSIKFYLFKSLRRKLTRAKGRGENIHATDLASDYSHLVTPSHESVLIAEQNLLEKKEWVMMMLNTLTKRQQEAIFLRYFEDLNCDEIAAVMEVSKQAVYNLVSIGLEKLKTVFGGKE
jgi:RNA polymerase sigma factor (sigma-70 family)